MVARVHRHPHADVVPPVEPRSDGEHDSVLRRRLVAAGWHNEAGASDPVRVEFLDHDAIEEWAELVAHKVLGRRVATVWRTDPGPGRMIAQGEPERSEMLGFK